MIAGEHMARSGNHPPEAAIRKAYASAIQQDDLGLYHEDGTLVTEEELDDHAEDSELDATNCLITTVTSIDYQMPRRQRIRIPSGPYRRVTQEERDTITQ